MEAAKGEDSSSVLGPSVLAGPLGRAWYAFCLFVSRIAGLLLFDVRCYGHHRVVRRGSCVVASNHGSFLDPWIVGMSIPRASYYLARETLFRIPLFGRLIYSVNARPIPREGGAASRRAIRISRQIVDEGGLLLMFPEGTRSEDGRLAAVKRGVELIAGPSAAPVVPAYIDGSFESWPRHRRLPRWHPVRVFFGDPIEPEERRTQVTRSKPSCADLTGRLSAAFRSLEAEARRVRGKGAAAPDGRLPMYFG